VSKGKKYAPTYWKRNEVRSGLEARVRKNLDECKIDYEYETLKLPYVKQVCPHCKEVIKKGNYIPDFIIGDLICEVKGRFTSEDRKKHLAVKEEHPDKIIKILFQRDQKISKNSKTYYSDWCDKYEIPYAFGETVPEEWLQDVKSSDRLEVLQEDKSTKRKRREVK